MANFGYTEKLIDELTFDASNVRLDEPLNNKLKRMTINISSMSKLSTDDILDIIRIYRHNKSIIDRVITSEFIDSKKGELTKELEFVKDKQKKAAFTCMYIRDNYAKGKKEKDILDIIIKRLSNGVEITI
jgi:KaiC/GvpD/RAD55 family RecA-like ATPase